MGFWFVFEDLLDKHFSSHLEDFLDEETLLGLGIFWLIVEGRLRFGRLAGRKAFEDLLDDDWSNWSVEFLLDRGILRECALEALLFSFPASLLAQASHRFRSHEKQQYLKKMLLTIKSPVWSHFTCSSHYSESLSHYLNTDRHTESQVLFLPATVTTLPCKFDSWDSDVLEIQQESLLDYRT